MTARILVVDDVLPNVKILEAKLSVEYFDVITASNGADAIELVHSENPDLILLDVMMPQMDGFEVCRRLKADPLVAHIPVVMVTALSESADRVEGLKAGADDFLTKPVDDVSLFARVKSLVRLKMMMDELRLREETSQDLGVIGYEDSRDAEELHGRILIVDDNDFFANQVRQYYGDVHSVSIEDKFDEALMLVRSSDFDLVIINLGIESFDPLRLCSQIRTIEETRQLPILTIADESEKDRLVKGLELGTNDYVMRPLDPNELIVRTRTQLLRKKYQDRLRQNYHRSMELAVTDSLTGLYNRRYMTNHLHTLLHRARQEYKPVSILMLDIDFFKAVNDTHGHDIGDLVLKDFAGRVVVSVRGVDLASRYGGEEFVVVMPDTDLSMASGVAERLRRQVAEEVFKIEKDGLELNITCSVGVTVSKEMEDVDELLKRADEALYMAKREGRNRVVVTEAASG